ncbi:uncharacterized protein LOC118766725 [Octopus sinensis]|uniref:Uncharacterized protein LOC118766725 n=1 Tax=Octopus sinensis TaxID=2607531 RepID=A0A7E6FEW0_9MOLL|nr:uncharacterized protein LOC118766725 [Octopus sinensis]
MEVVTNYSYEYELEHEYEYRVFGNDATGWLNIVLCISIIIVVLFDLFLMVAIFLDRKSHGKRRSLSLLNYLLNYALDAVFAYFQSLHIFIVQDLPKSHCLFIVILSYAFNDGVKYFLIPLCCEFIVKYFSPSRYENQIFLIIQSVLIGTLWVFISIKALVMFLAFSYHRSNSCYIHLDSSAIQAQFIMGILLMIAMLVFVGLLIYIAIKSKEEEMMKSQVKTLIIITAVIITLFFLNYVIGAGFVGLTYTTLAIIYRVTNIAIFLLLPFLWLFDTTIRQSIRNLCSRNYAKSKDHRPHELTEIN